MNTARSSPGNAGNVSGCCKRFKALKCFTELFPGATGSLSATPGEFPIPKESGSQSPWCEGWDGLRDGDCTCGSPAPEGEEGQEVTCGCCRLGAAVGHPGRALEQGPGPRAVGAARPVVTLRSPLEREQPLPAWRRSHISGVSPGGI